MPLDILYSVCFSASTVFFSTPICILIYYSSITSQFMFFSTHTQYLHHLLVHVLITHLIIPLHTLILITKLTNTSTINIQKSIMGKKCLTKHSFPTPYILPKTASLSPLCTPLHTQCHVAFRILTRAFCDFSKGFYRVLIGCLQYFP